MEIDADLTEPPLISTPPAPELPACLAAEEEAGRGYPLVNVTCLSATLPLVNCPDYYCDNVAIKKETGGGGGCDGPRDRCAQITRQWEMH